MVLMVFSPPEMPGGSNKATRVQMLFVKHSTAIRGYLLGLLPDPHQVDDLMQSVFCTVTEQAETWDESRDFVPWARGIGRNLFLRLERSKRQGPQILDPELIDALTQVAPSFEADTTRLEALKQCMNRLAPRARQAITLRYSQALKPAEIARRMSLAVASVNVMLSQARASLRECVLSKLRIGRDR